MPIITLRFKDKKIRDYPIAAGQSCTIGRKQSNDIVIDNLAVSGKHAVIESVSANFVLRDLESTNGTFINKEKVTQRNLRHKDLITIGKHELLFDRSDLMKKSAKETESFEDDNTRILDTSEYRHLMNKEETNPPPAKNAVDTTEQNQDEDSSIIKKMMKKVF